MKVILVQRGISSPTHFVCGKSLKTYGSALYSAEHSGAIYEMSLAEYAKDAHDLIGNMNSGQQWVPLFVEAPVVPVAPAAPVSQPTPTIDPVKSDFHAPTIDPDEPAVTVDPDEHAETPQVTTMFIGSEAEAAEADEPIFNTGEPMGYRPPAGLLVSGVELPLTPIEKPEDKPPVEAPKPTAAELIQTLVSKEVGAMEARLMAAIERNATSTPKKKLRKIEPTSLQRLQAEAKRIGLPVEGQSEQDLRTAINTLHNAEAPA